MKQKYWVPAVERAYIILDLIAEYPDQLRLIDLSKQSGINKSSLYSLLNTLEQLTLLRKEKGGTYTLGAGIAKWSSAYFRQFDILQAFYREAASSVNKIQEHMQVGILQGGDVLYLGKLESNKRIHLITNPGMWFPAYASAIGKSQLLNYTKSGLMALYPQHELDQKTPFTLSNVDVLYENLQAAQGQGYITEAEEASLEFHCVGAPILNYEKDIIAGVSFTMLKPNWTEKSEDAKVEIVQLANRLSKQAGYNA